MKLLSLLKVALSEDMNLFNYKTKSNNRLSKTLIPIFLFFIVSFAMGTYAFILASELSKVNLIIVMLTIFLLLVTIMTFMEGVYKSQGVLFETKDNDVLFSLPISKQTILFIRIFKLLIFQYLYNLMFILPAILIYIYYEHPGFIFYPITIIMTFLVPIIPTVISSIIGYLIKIFSNTSTNKKAMQTLLSTVVFIVIYFGMMNIDKYLEKIATHASSINEIITKFYYPIGIYIDTINTGNIFSFIKLLLVNIIPLVLFIVIGSKYYFKLLTKSNNKKIIINKEYKIKKRSKIISLSFKELKRYLSSPVYIFNTIFGILLLLMSTIVICIKGNESFLAIIKEFNLNIDPNIVTFLIYYALLLVMLFMTSITSSSISIEGKSMNITKSLPIKEKELFLSKILLCFYIEMPFVLLSIIIYSIRFKLNIIYMIYMIILSILVISLSGIIGIIVNIKYPKLNWKNDTEVVKESISTLISLISNILLMIISVSIVLLLIEYIFINIAILIHLLLLTILNIILYKYLINKSKKEYRQINI